jgi:hypothetical protein
MGLTSRVFNHPKSQTPIGGVRPDTVIVEILVKLQYAVNQWFTLLSMSALLTL